MKGFNKLLESMTLKNGFRKMIASHRHPVYLPSPDKGFRNMMYALYSHLISKVH